MNGNRVAVTEEYTVINLRYEYPGFVGAEKYAVASDLGKEALESIYGDELKSYVPYVVISKAEAEAMLEFGKNEDKHAKRQKRSVDAYGYEESMTEMNHDELIQDNLFNIVSANLDKERLRKFLPMLTGTQRKRIKLYYYDQLPIRAIADLEGADVHAVHKSIQSAIKKLKKLFEE